MSLKLVLANKTAILLSQYISLTIQSASFTSPEDANEISL